MLAQVLVDDIATIVNDIENVTYPIQQVISAINDGQRVVCQYRPDAKSSTISLQLVAGSKQTIPSTARRLIDVVRNMGTDGLTVGRAVRSTVKMIDLDTYDPDWHNTVDSNVSQFIYDNSRPEEFYIYPTVALPHFLEIKTADNPVNITLITDEIDINEIYVPEITKWAVHVLLSRDSDNSPNMQRAQAFEQSFYQLMGVKIQSDSQVSAKENK